jgi:hypothetical protein
MQNRKGGIIPAGPTEVDLGLGTNPERGGFSPAEVFHFK